MFLALRWFSQSLLALLQKEAIQQCQRYYRRIRHRLAAHEEKLTSQRITEPPRAVRWTSPLLTLYHTLLAGVLSVASFLVQRVSQRGSLPLFVVAVVLLCNMAMAYHLVQINENLDDFRLHDDSPWRDEQDKILGQLDETRQLVQNTIYILHRLQAETL